MKTRDETLTVLNITRESGIGGVLAAGLLGDGLGRGLLRGGRLGRDGGGGGARGTGSVRRGALMPVVPVVAGGRRGRGAQQVVQDVDYGADVALGPTVPVLQRGVQRAAERARVHALAVVVHRLDYRSLAALRVLLWKQKFVG